MERNMKKLGRTILVAGALLAGTALAAPYVELPDGRKVPGQRIRALPDGTVNLMTSAGVVPYAPGTYRRAVADRPAEMDAALAAVKAQKYDEAIKLFDKIVRDFRFLNWDVEAQKELAKAYLAKKDGEHAVEAFKKLFQMSPEEKANVDTQWLSRRAMLAAKQYATLAKELDAVVAAGARTDAAKAQNMRGDIQLAQNNLEAALLDYLRTATLFADVADAQVQGEACFKAAQVLEQLRDNRAKAMYQKVATEYRASPYAQEAAKKVQ